MRLINKCKDEIKAYNYFLKFNVNGNIRYYYGCRYGNVKENRLPKDDLFKIYFTSSKSVKNLLDQNIFPFEIIIHKTFETSKEACLHEIKFLCKVDALHRFDFLNHSNTLDSSSVYKNRGRIKSFEEKEKMKIASKLAQSSKEYKEDRSKEAKERWASEEFKNYMKNKYEEFNKNEKGKLHKEKVRHANVKRTGERRTEESLIKKKESAINFHKNNPNAAKDWLSKRIIYTCPICQRTKLNGGLFNAHMLNHHNWSKDQSTNFKEIIKHFQNQQLNLFYFLFSILLLSQE